MVSVRDAGDLRVDCRAYTWHMQLLMAQLAGYGITTWRPLKHVLVYAGPYRGHASSCLSIRRYPLRDRRDFRNPCLARDFGNMEPQKGERKR
jgi:hypothetical protein